jgi:hypothetical protein
MSRFFLLYLQKLTYHTDSPGDDAARRSRPWIAYTRATAVI